jgi:hypothetical protein
LRIRSAGSGMEWSIPRSRSQARMALERHQDIDGGHQLVSWEPADGHPRPDRPDGMEGPSPHCPDALGSAEAPRPLLIAVRPS